MPHAGGVDHAERVRAESVHVPVRRRDAAVAHGDGDLMQGLGQQTPPVPLVVRAVHVGPRITFDNVVEVGELQRIPVKEDRRVRAYNVPVAFFGVELQGEAADVAHRVGGTAFAGVHGETGEHLGLQVDFGEDLGGCVPGDVVGHRECAVRAGPFGVHAAFGDELAVKVGQLLQVPDVLQQHRASRAGGHDIVVVHHRRTTGGGELADSVLTVALVVHVCRPPLD